MLKTPLGEIIVSIDETETEYTAAAAPLDHRCNKLNGRYYICIEHENDSKPHTITCRISGYTLNEKDGAEDGEDLLLMSFFKGSAKLSIGVEFDYCGKYDYDAVHLQDGMQFRVFPQTKTKYFVFGIAWIDDCDDENEIHTWFGADPTLMYTPNSKQRIDKYIDNHKVCGDNIFNNEMEFLNVLYSYQGKVEVIVWFEYCKISEQEKSLGGGGWIDKQNPEYMWAETPIYEVDFQDKTLNEVLDYIKRIRSEYPRRKMYPAFYLYDGE